MKAIRKKSNIINLKEFRENADFYIKRINSGESFTVLKRSNPVFKLIPVDGDEGHKELWETIVDFTQEYPEGMPAEELIKQIKKMHG